MPSRSLLAVLLAALSLAPAVGALPGLPAREAEPEPLLLDLTGATDRTVALPLGAPMPAASTGLGPGTPLIIELPTGTFGCTANFVWTSGRALYLGAAGHCFLPEDKVATHGPGADFDASDVRVRACVAACTFGGQTGFILEGTTVELGRVAYARQSRDGIGPGNDFGVVVIPERHHSLVRNAMPVWGRMTGVEARLDPGELVCHYGNAGGLGEVFATKARLGAGVLTLSDGSWRAATPSFQGDSGAALATCRAAGDSVTAVGAVGVLTHLTAAGVAGVTVVRAQQLASEAGLSLTASL